MPSRDAASTLREAEFGSTNYYVVVPFMTVESAKWALGHIGCQFDAAVIADVNQDALVVEKVDA